MLIFLNQTNGRIYGGFKFYFHNCNQGFDSETTYKIYSSSNILTIIIKRGKDNKDNIKLDFIETLDLTPL